MMKEKKEGFVGCSHHQMASAMEWLILHLLLIIFLFITAIGILPQPTAADPSGFITIDCGRTNRTNFIGNYTGLTYVTDEGYTDFGINAVISSKYSTLEVLSTLRYFPNGTRNCYTLTPVIRYQKYLLRARFTYGNYYGLHMANHINPLQFDLYIDVNLWTTVKITDESKTIQREAIIVSSVNNSVSVCLVNTGNGVPFISTLELRPIDYDMYSHVNASQFLLLYFREKQTYCSDSFSGCWSNCATYSIIICYLVSKEEE